MPVFWREALNGRWVVIVYSDPYTLSDTQRALEEIFAHPLGQPPMRLLIDRRYSSAPDAEIVRGLVACGERRQQNFVGARVAAVVANDAGFGMGRMLENLVEAKALPLTVRTFRDWQAAEQWLAGGETPLRS